MNTQKLTHFVRSIIAPQQVQEEFIARIADILNTSKQSMEKMAQEVSEVHQGVQRWSDCLPTENEINDQHSWDKWYARMQIEFSMVVKEVEANGREADSQQAKRIEEVKSIMETQAETKGLLSEDSSQFTKLTQIKQFTDIVKSIVQHIDKASSLQYDTKFYNQDRMLGINEKDIQTLAKIKNATYEQFDTQRNKYLATSESAIDELVQLQKSYRSIVAKCREIEELLVIQALREEGNKNTYLDYIGATFPHVITGSYALYLQGKVEEFNDIDIIVSQSAEEFNDLRADSYQHEDREVENYRRISRITQLSEWQKDNQLSIHVLRIEEELFDELSRAVGETGIMSAEMIENYRIHQAFFREYKDGEFTSSYQKYMPPMTEEEKGLIPRAYHIVAQVGEQLVEITPELNSAAIGYNISRTTQEELSKAKRQPCKTTAEEILKSLPEDYKDLNPKIQVVIPEDNTSLE